MRTEDVHQGLVGDLLFHLHYELIDALLTLAEINPVVIIQFKQPLISTLLIHVELGQMILLNEIKSIFQTHVHLIVKNAIHEEVEELTLSEFLVLKW